MVCIEVPNKIYVRLYAGMGDFYKRYFGHPTWRCLEDLKAKNPNTEISALLVSQTIPALELVDYHPYLDKIIKPNIHLREFKNQDITKYVGDSVFLNQKVAKQFKEKIPPIYLSDEDKDFVNRMTKDVGKYICLHPFSGDRYGLDTRTPLTVAQYIPIIESLLDSGFKVMMLGKSWERINLGSKSTRIVEEKFKFSRPGFINLINKTNARTGAELIKRSNGFVGTASSMMCAAWSMGGIKTTIITSQRWIEPLRTMPWAQDKIDDPNHQVLYLNHDRSPKKFKEIAHVTTKWF